jgi:hypothetical protein
MISCAVGRAPPGQPKSSGGPKLQKKYLPRTKKCIYSEEMDRKGYLLIEVIFGLSLFAMIAGIVTHGFLIGLRLFREARTDSSEAVVTMLLINRIKRNNAARGTNIPIKLGREEWQLNIENANLVANNVPDLWALGVAIAKLKDSAGNNVPLEEKKYNIFRYLP